MEVKAQDGRPWAGRRALQDETCVLRVAEVVDEKNKRPERTRGQNWAGRLQEARWKVKMLPSDEIVRSEQFKIILDAA